MNTAPGNSLPMLESCANGQTLPEQGPGVTAGLDQALDGGVDGQRAAAGIAGGSGEECKPAGPIEPPQDDRLQDGET